MTAPKPAAAAPSSAPFAKGSIIWEKKGPLPVWAWAALLLLGLLVFVWWRRGSSSEAEYTGSSSEIPGDQMPPGVWIVPVSPPPPVNIYPPAGGGYGYPTEPPRTTPPAPPGGGSPPPTTPPGGGTPPPAPAGGYVTVTKWPDTDSVKTDSLWNIARTWLPEGSAQWGLIWNHPLNAAVRQQRGVPEKIRPGDRFFVPNKRAKPRMT